MTMIQGLKLKRHDFSNRVDPVWSLKKDPKSHEDIEDFSFLFVC